VREEQVVLEDDADRSPIGGYEHPSGRVIEYVVTEAYVASRQAIESREAAQQ
jgi:hypothetical protein